MDSKRLRKPLSQFVHQASDIIKVDEVILFGSHLEGNATEESDIDVMVISDSFQGMDMDRRLNLLYKASSQVEPDIHPWGFTPKELKAASHLTLLGYARDHGVHFDLNSLTTA
jgi:uncharacterized protein